MEIRYYKTRRGDEVVLEWLRNLSRDDQRKVRKLIMFYEFYGSELMGDKYRYLGEKLFELRDLSRGPGFRVYGTRRGDMLAILLVGGDKSTQRRDIAIARERIAELDEEEIG